MVRLAEEDLQMDADGKRSKNKIRAYLRSLADKNKKWMK